MARFASPDAFIEKMSQEQELGDKVFNRKLVEYWEEFRPKIESFKKIFGADKVLADSRRVADRERDWDARRSDSRKLEYMVMDGIGRRDWFGDTTDVTPASEYDDVFNGIDVVVRFDRDNQRSLYLGIDVTATQRVEKVQEKLGRTLSQLLRGKSDEIRYYPPSPEGLAAEELPLHLPRVVIGTDRDGVRRLYEQYASALSDFGTMASINEHPIQSELLRQVRRQLMLSTEAASRAYVADRTVQRFLPQEKFSSINQEVSVIKRLELDDLEYGRWDEFIKVLNNDREALISANPQLAGNIFMNADLADEIAKIADEKSSQGIIAEGAHAETEQLLEVPHKSALSSYREFHPLRSDL